jgi:hypothetical protein
MISNWKLGTGNSMDLGGSNDSRKQEVAGRNPANDKTL